jgi:pimeloyl-ACP methyl ester carboxylesterase
MPHAYTARWSPGAQDRTIEVRPGLALRYLRIGQGPPLVLLHTIRTQLDYFQRLAPLLAQRYTLYIVDLPGHGQSTISHADHTEQFFRRAVVQFIEKLDLRDVSIAGESIGGVLALTVATDLPQRIARIVSINPYDYGESFGGGIRRSKSGWIIGLFALFRQYTLEPRFLLNRVFAGAMKDPRKFPEDLALEFFRTGKRTGYRWVEYSVFANWRSWIEARKRYPTWRVPVTLVYSEFDWSRPDDRRRTQAELPGARTVVVPNAGHFSCLEAPGEIAAIISAQ